MPQSFPALVAMVLVHELVHPRGLSFTQQKKVVCLRGEWLSWEKIAQRVKNLKVGGVENAVGPRGACGELSR